jgi:hypothetical protein
MPVAVILNEVKDLSIGLGSRCLSRVIDQLV